MQWLRHFAVILLVTASCGTASILISQVPEKRNNDSKFASGKVTPLSNKVQSAIEDNSHTNNLDYDLTANGAQESTNFFTADLGAPFDSSSDYGALFDNFPSLPYFPEFGEIFRISRTTTPQPPFRFPDYVRDAFPDRPPENTVKPLAPSSGSSTVSSYGDSVGGGRRPSRRPPRPASSGTRTKVSKQNHNEPKEKPKSLKSKAPSKSRDYPKIFRFTSDRVNLAEFDMKKKMNENYLTLTKGDELDSDKVKRNKFLILHGGVFEIERSGRSGLYHASSNNHPEKAAPDSEYVYNPNLENDKVGLESMQYFYKT
ncbi:uncharacterized protein LOC118181179 [Stegodyphus dumicola]|uniref:uncharacterized protein LOC118181179 n=1 Tax=Stegodyphus dumicola TaxID=202533 RepID=UPI0015AA935E|nr:uncharacterized protein LOC118181179 [Stegodyphus dumicola]